MISSSIAWVSVGSRSRERSLRSRPSMRIRGAEPTLQCRSDPVSSDSARRNGLTDSGSTAWSGTVAGAVVTCLLSAARPASLSHP